MLEGDVDFISNLGSVMTKSKVWNFMWIDWLSERKLLFEYYIDFSLIFVIDQIYSVTKKEINNAGKLIVYFIWLNNYNIN